MPNEIINKTTDQITHYSGDRDPYESLADDVAPRDLIGKPLRYAKGDYILGRKGEEEDVPLGSTMIAFPSLMLRGWVRWQDSKPTDKLFARVALGERPPNRFALGDHNPALWEQDKFGNTRDPWADTMMLPLLWPSDDLPCTFSTSSWGGRRALGELARGYAKGRRAQPADALPLVEFQSRNRQSREYGKTPEPMLILAGWEPLERHRVALDAAGILELLGEEPLPPPSAAAPKIGATFAPNARERQASKPDFDDSIPF